MNTLKFEIQKKWCRLKSYGGDLIKPPSALTVFDVKHGNALMHSCCCHTAASAGYDAMKCKKIAIQFN